MTTTLDPRAHDVARLRGGAAAAAPLHLRLMSKVVVDNNGCWIWTRERSNGYGRIVVGGRRRAAHRVAYELFVGPIPDGLQLDHLCRVPPCINPEHLEPVTCKDNLHRSPSTQATVNAAATHCWQGHAFDLDNTRIDPRTGKRECRACQRAKTARLRANWTVEQRHAHVLAEIAKQRRIQQRTIAGAVNSGNPWTAAEDAVVLRRDLTRERIAVLLGRTFKAVCQRRHELQVRGW